MFNPGTSLGKIVAEYRHATAAIAACVPCAIAFDTVLPQFRAMQPQIAQVVSSFR